MEEHSEHGADGSEGGLWGSEAQVELGNQHTRAGDLKAKGGSKQLGRTTEGGSEGLKEA